MIAMPHAGGNSFVGVFSGYTNNLFPWLILWLILLIENEPRAQKRRR